MLYVVENYRVLDINFKIAACCFDATYVTLRSKSKDNLSRNQECPRAATCLPVDCCYSETSNSLIGQVQNRHHYRPIKIQFVLFIYYLLYLPMSYSI